MALAESFCLSSVMFSTLMLSGMEQELASQLHAFLQLFHDWRHRGLWNVEHLRIHGVKACGRLWLQRSLRVYLMRMLTFDMRHMDGDHIVMNWVFL